MAVLTTAFPAERWPGGSVLLGHSCFESRSLRDSDARFIESCRAPSRARELWTCVNQRLKFSFEPPIKFFFSQCQRGEGSPLELTGDGGFDLNKVLGRHRPSIQRAVPNAPKVPHV